MVRKWVNAFKTQGYDGVKSFDDFQKIKFNGTKNGIL